MAKPSVIFLIISIQIVISFQRKIELILSKVNSGLDTHINLTKDDKNSTFLNANHEFLLQSFIFRLEGDLKYQDGNLVYIINEPDYHFQLYRCKKISQQPNITHLQNSTFFRLSIFDDFGSDFDMHFNKKSFELNLSDPYDKLLSYYCRGISLDKRDIHLNLTKITNNMFDYAIKALFSEETAIFPFINSLKFNENNHFICRVSLISDRIDGFYLEVNSNENSQLYWPASLEITNYKRLFLWQNKYNLLKLYDFLGKNTINYTIYSWDFTTQTLVSRKERKIPYTNYVSSYEKSVTGSGLHQNVDLKFVLESENLQLSKEIIKGKCTLVIVDYLDDTNYLDIEEMINDPNYKLMTFNVIDIEKPSSVSFQHIYLIKYLINKENKLYEGNNVKITVSLKYPIHFRYRRPHHDIEYKTAFVNRKPEFYFDCLNLNYHMNSTSQTPIDLLVNGKISKVMAKVNSNSIINKDDNLDNLIVLVPTGNLNHLPIVIVITLVVTLSSALYISIKTLQKKTEKYVVSQNKKHK